METTISVGRTGRRKLRGEPCSSLPTSMKRQQRQIAHGSNGTRPVVSADADVSGGGSPTPSFRSNNPRAVGATNGGDQSTAATSAGTVAAKLMPSDRDHPARNNASPPVTKRQSRCSRKRRTPTRGSSEIPPAAHVHPRQGSIQARQTVPLIVWCRLWNKRRSCRRTDFSTSGPTDSRRADRGRSHTAICMPPERTLVRAAWRHD